MDQKLYSGLRCNSDKQKLITMIKRVSNYFLTLIVATTVAVSVHASPGVVIEYIEGEDKAQAAALLEDNVLEDGIEFINEVFTLQRDITVIVGAEAGPLYDPSVSEIYLPYHFYGEVLQRISQIENDAEQQIVFANDAMLHTLFHELGHALIDQLDLPVVGREEDAVDGLASMLLLEYYEDGADMAANAAELFALEGEERGELEAQDFWDEHSLDEQRYYSTICHIVGSDPQQYQGLAEEIGFSEERVDICDGIYQQLVSDWELLLDEVFAPERGH